MESDLVKRLRDNAYMACYSGCEGRCKVCPADLMKEAADALSRRDEATVVVPSAEAVRLANEVIRLGDPFSRSYLLAREILRLAAAQGEGKP